MLKYAFVSRHDVTEEQEQIAKKAGIELIPVGDYDGFKITSQEVMDKHDFCFDGYVCVHSGAVARLLQEGMPVGIFNNINRAPVGEKPQFGTDALYIYNYRIGNYTDDVKVTINGLLKGGQF